MKKPVLYRTNGGRKDPEAIHRSHEIKFMKRHTYEIRVDWTGNDGQGTSTYRSYRRDHSITAAGKPVLNGSSDPSFRGDATRYSPEDLLVASLSACHMLWYLHLCSVNQISVLEYKDDALGYMDETENGSGAFVRVLLRPNVTIAQGGDPAKAHALHEEAHGFCFIAKSVNFPVEIEPKIVQK
jgi:organic hydroperoxide reductase OsmC/OhrA